MIKNQVLCDVCGQPMPTEIIEDPVLGQVETVRLYRTREWDTRILFSHLCESCALKIDNALLKLKNDMQMDQIIASRNKKLNTERREKLGTNG